jgi:EAL domain-containing protein (putative c-di-GMP-specific phosphodiesterase class I)
VAKFVTSDTFKSLGLDYIEVNLSVVECQDKALIQRIEKIVNKYNLDPRLINLEITESVDYINKAVMDSNIASLRRMGFNFSLDDYGVGYSNIERFATLPISIVKIDKSLVDDADKPSMQSVLVDTFRLIHDLNRKTVVEGVETKDQLERFITLKATYIQGYYFSKPLEYREFIDFINKSLEVEL